MTRKCEGVLSFLYEGKEERVIRKFQLVHMQFTNVFGSINNGSSGGFVLLNHISWSKWCLFYLPYYRILLFKSICDFPKPCSLTWRPDSEPVVTFSVCNNVACFFNIILNGYDSIVTIPSRLLWLKFWRQSRECLTIRNNAVALIMAHHELSDMFTETEQLGYYYLYLLLISVCTRNSTSLEKYILYARQAQFKLNQREMDSCVMHY